MISRFACSLLLGLFVSPAMAQSVLKREPPENGLPAGQSVLVDDGSCPAGQIKRVVGGSEGKRTRRQRTCVARSFGGARPVERSESQGGY